MSRSAQAKIVVSPKSSDMKNLVPVDNKIQVLSLPAPCMDNIYSKKAYAYQICSMFAGGREYQRVTEGGDDFYKIAFICE